MNPRLERAEACVHNLLLLESAESALLLRLAMDLAWIRFKDPGKLGYSTFGKYFDNRVDVVEKRWANRLMRLAQSDLPRVKAAVVNGDLTLTVATRAPCQVKPGHESSWLLDACGGRGEFHEVDTGTRRRRRSRTSRVELRGSDKRAVQEARATSRLLVGQPLRDPQADRFYLNLWRKGKKGKEILHEARKKRPAPDHAPPLPWGPRDPTVELLGPWTEPRSEAECAKRIDVLQDLIRNRTLIMGRYYAEIVKGRLYRELGFSSARRLVRQTFQCSERSLQRYRKRAELVDADPPVVQAVERGLTLDRAVRLRAAVAEERWSDWLEVAPRILGIELDRVLPDLRDPGAEARWLRDYRDLAARTPAATDKISLRRTFHRRVGGQRLRVHPDLPRAARWFLRQATPAPQNGFGKVKERDDFTCRNPECRAETIQAHAHHHVPKSQGGTNDLENGLCLCPACHLRGVHTGRIQCEIRGDLEIWTYPGRRVVVG